MNQPDSAPRDVAGFAAVTLALVVLLVGLGVWQLQRRVEKHHLIAALNERLAAAPTPLPSETQWSILKASRDEFRRVRFSAAYADRPDAMVFGSGSAIRPDVSGPGTWAFVPARLSDGSVVVINAGFIQNTMQDRGLEDRAVKPLLTGQPVILTGYLRFPERAGWLTPAADLNKRLWFVRDQQDMAKALGWGEVAPFYVDLETPVPANGIPLPGPLQVRLRDEHMQYAITWFALAFAVVVAFGAWWRGQTRKAR